jgi:hypothetical protein
MKINLEGVMLAIVTFFIGGTVGSFIESDSWKKQTVERYFAEYSPITGEWRWKDNVRITVIDGSYQYHTLK